MNRPDLTGHTALVTGSAKGIGRGIVLAIAECGADIAVHYHTSDDAARETAATARERHGVDTTTVQGDVTDPDAVDSVFDAIETDLGRVDLLVNNVGDFAPTHWENIDWEAWNRVLDTNFNATYLCSKRALAPMRDAEHGRIVNIGYASSEKGLVSPTNFPYFVAKAGVLMFTRMLAADITERSSVSSQKSKISGDTQREGITVNAVSPYVVETSDAFPEELPRDRPATLSDVIDPVLFFLGGSAYISGQNIEVDGGWLPETV